jgi:asparagine synthase (glutamine-hydrolysing)
MPWLRPEIAREARQAMVERVTHGPLRCDRAIMVARTFRCHQGALRCLAATSAETGTDVVVPYYDAALSVAMARASGWRGRGSRGSVLKAQVGHLLPERALDRTDTTNFQRVLWGHRARAFAEGWSGASLDTEMVDPEALRQEWLSDSPDFRTAGLLQLAWLAETATQAARPLVAQHA